ncbi:MAG: argininosuccinate lyase, partial [Clostridia bacterium]|nr:argininosuccinate lyase [Clostridia bacterium]
TIEELKAASPLFEEDVRSSLAPEACVAGRKAQGGPAPEQVKAQIAAIRKFLGGLPPMDPD